MSGRIACFMRNRLKNIVQPALFAFALAFASVVNAMAATDMATGQSGTFTMVICAAQGPVTVAVDASGQPSDPSSEFGCDVCPVCTFHADALHAMAPIWARPARLPRHLTFQLVTAQHSDSIALWNFARGPPNDC